MATVEDKVKRLNEMNMSDHDLLISVTAHQQHMGEDIKEIKARLKDLPCSDMAQRVSVVEVSTKRNSVIYGTLSGAITAVLAFLTKIAIGK